jgi:hypothetical protein
MSMLSTLEFFTRQEQKPGKCFAVKNEFVLFVCLFVCLLACRRGLGSKAG